MTYRATSGFPNTERYGLTSQMRRAAISVPANIAEGCGRSGNRALIAFLHVALGSATELECLADVAVEVGACKQKDVVALLEEISTTKAMVSRLIAKLRERKDRP